MTRAEPLANPAEQTPATSDTEKSSDVFPEGGSLRDAVNTSVAQYLKALDGQMTTDVYAMVLAEMEAPLLAQIMQYTKNNQTKASIMLGLNRGTLRKKLKQYGLIARD